MCYSKYITHLTKEVTVQIPIDCRLHIFQGVNNDAKARSIESIGKMTSFLSHIMRLFDFGQQSECTMGLEDNQVAGTICAGNRFNFNRGFKRQKELQ